MCFSRNKCLPVCQRNPQHFPGTLGKRLFRLGHHVFLAVKSEDVVFSFYGVDTPGFARDGVVNRGVSTEAAVAPKDNVDRVVLPVLVYLPPALKVPPIHRRIARTCPGHEVIQCLQLPQLFLRECLGFLGREARIRQPELGLELVGVADGGH